MCDVPGHRVGAQILSVFEEMRASGVTAAMVRRGWSETRTRKVLGENWLRFLGEVWGE